jgi:hypothetical protein
VQFFNTLFLPPPSSRPTRVSFGDARPAAGINGGKSQSIAASRGKRSGLRRTEVADPGPPAVARRAATGSGPGGSATGSVGVPFDADSDSDDDQGRATGAPGGGLRSPEAAFAAAAAGPVRRIRVRVEDVAVELQLPPGIDPQEDSVIDVTDATLALPQNVDALRRSGLFTPRVPAGYVRG